MSQQYKKNLYVCEVCDLHIITIDRDNGTTPYLMGCQTELCNALMRSRVYRIDQAWMPSHEWYKPSEEETAKQNPAIKQHIEFGGLLLRKIEE